MNTCPWNERMLADLNVAGMAQRTQEAYLRAVRQLSQYWNNTPPDALTEQLVKDYLLWLRTEKRAAPGTLKIAIGGLRFFYRQTHPTEWKVLDRFRIPKEKRLPNVLTVPEVRRILHAIRQPRFHACFRTVYSCGLRLNEALVLQIGDIDSERMRIHGHRGKGPKTASCRCRNPLCWCCEITGRFIDMRSCCFQRPAPKAAWFHEHDRR